VNYPATRKAVTASNLSLTSRTAIQFSAFFQQTATGRPVNCSVNTTASQKSFVGCIDYRIYLLLCNIGFNDCYPV
jgi:hypothetical protein